MKLSKKRTSLHFEIWRRHNKIKRLSRHSEEKHGPLSESSVSVMGHSFSKKIIMENVHKKHPKMDVEEKHWSVLRALL